MGQIKELFEYIFNAVKIWVIVQPWEQGIRVRGGRQVKLISGGIHFKIPYIDSVYVQESRLRMMQIGVQTLTTKDLKTLTINSCIGYSIADIEKLYNTIYHPEATITSLVSSIAADFIFNNELLQIHPEKVEQLVIERLNVEDYGILFESYKITNFAAVRTYRLIQEQSKWIDSEKSELIIKK